MGAQWVRRSGRPGRRVPGVARAVVAPAVLVSVAVAGGGATAAVAGHHRQVGASRTRRDGPGVMSVIAGGVGGPAWGPRVILGGACGVSYAGGRVYVADDSMTRWLYPQSGWLTTPAGIGSAFQFSPPLGDGGPAVSASLANACGATSDHHGDIVIGDAGDNRVRVVARHDGNLYGRAVTRGDIYTVAGTGTAGFSGDGHRAGSARLNNPRSVTVDGGRNVVIADTGNNRIRVVAASTGTFYGPAMTAGDIYTVAGNGTAGYSGNGGPAVAAELNNPGGVAVDGAGNLVIADTGNNRIRVVAASTGTFYGQPMTAGDIYTVAGNGTAGFSGDGGLATSAKIANPGGVGLDGVGNLVIADTGNNRIRVVAASTGTFYGQPMRAGDIYTVAGKGSAGYSGNGRPALAAELNNPGGVAVDGAGNLVIADTGNNRIRVVAAGTGTSYAQAMTAGDIYTVAGSPRRFLSGQGLLATSAEFVPNGMYPGVSSVTVDQSGNTVLDSPSAIRVMVVPASSGTFYGQTMTAGRLYSIAGDGGFGFAGDGGPAARAEFEYPSGMAIDRHGNVLLADSQNHRVRVVAEKTGTFYGQEMTAGDVYTIAGDGQCGDSGDGGPGTAAELCLTTAVAMDAAGNVLVSQASFPAIRVIAASNGTFYGQKMTTGDIYTVAGDGNTGYSGDGGRATRAEFNFPEGVAVDGFGNVLIGDTFNNRVRVAAESTGTFYGIPMTAGDIYTVAGGGSNGLGDGGPAPAGELSLLAGLITDSAGNLLVADNGDKRIRVVPNTSGTYYGQQMAAGHIYTVAGNGVNGCAGHRGPATAAEFGAPYSVALTPSGDLLITDWGCRELREMTP